jgi:signal transduction histidine kinase
MSSLDLLPVFNAQPGATLLLSPEWIIMGASDDYLAATLTQRDSLVGQFIFDAFPDNPQAPEANGVANVRASLLRVMATKQPHEMAPQHYDVPDRTQSGRFIERHWQLRHTPVLDAAGEVQFIIQSVQDITAGKLSEQQLRELQAREQAALAEADAQRQHLHDVLMALPAYAATYRGPNHVYDLVSTNYQQLFPGRSISGQSIRDFLPELAGQGVFELLDHVYQTGELYYGQEVPTQVNYANTGRLERRYHNMYFQPTRDAAGTIDGLLSFAYDVTDQVLARRQVQHLNEELAATNEELAASNEEYLLANTALSEAQQQLQQLNAELEGRVQERTEQLQASYRTTQAQQAELQRLFAQAPMAIIVLRGPTFIIEQVNERAEAIWGRTAAQVLGRPHFEAVPDAVGQGFEELLTGVLASGEPVVLHEVPVKLHRAHVGLPATGYYSVIFKPLRDEHQRVTRIAVMWTESTDQVLARQQVQQLNEELTATNEKLHQSNTRLLHTNADLDNFIYTASHDLKAPISNIEGLLLALDHELPAAGRIGDVPVMLTLMQEATERFKRTIGHLTDVSRLQLEHSQAPEAVRLAAIIEAVRLDLLPLLAQTQGRLQVQVPAELTLTFSEKNLRSVVYNLLSNAFKYCHPDRVPEVDLRCWSAAGYHVLDVQDNGLGLDLSQGQAKLFALFQRLHTHVEGTGIGLYMVKKMVDNAGGRIEVESQLGQGTRFRVYFPR